MSLCVVFGSAKGPFINYVCYALHGEVGSNAERNKIILERAERNARNTLFSRVGCVVTLLLPIRDFRRKTESLDRKLRVKPQKSASEHFNKIWVHKPLFLHQTRPLKHLPARFVVLVVITQTFN